MALAATSMTLTCRLLVNISKLRSIADQQFTAEGLVVLFGPNRTMLDRYRLRR
jgi:hypothetical protein